MPQINYRRQRRHFIIQGERAVAAALRAREERMKTDHYGDLQVLRSAAGYYVGTLFWDSEFQFWSPGSRDSGYFPSYEAADSYLKYVTQDG